MFSLGRGDARTAWRHRGLAIRRRAVATGIAAAAVALPPPAKPAAALVASIDQDLIVAAYSVASSTVAT